MADITRAIEYESRIIRGKKQEYFCFEYKLLFDSGPYTTISLICENMNEEGSKRVYLRTKLEPAKLGEEETEELNFMICEAYRKLEEWKYRFPTEEDFLEEGNEWWDVHQYDEEEDQEKMEVKPCKK